MVEIVTQSGSNINVGIANLFRRLQSHLNQKSGKLIAQGMSDAIKAHFRFQFPGSSHYDPNKVNPSNESKLNEGVVDVDVPGVSRAYHDIDIVPKFRKYLTIPISTQSYGRKSSEFNNTFITFKKDGKTGLIGQKSDAGSVVWLYRLVKHVHQNQDSNLLPSDDTYTTNIFGRISAYINNLNS